MATIRQKKLARAIINSVKDNENITAGQLLEKVGYSKSMSTAKSGEVLDSKGVKEELENLGFTTEGADGVVQKILYKGKKEETKLKAADMVYKRLGSYKDTEQGASKTLIISISGETAQRYGITPKPSTDSTG